MSSTKQHTSGPWIVASDVVIRSQGRRIAIAMAVTDGDAAANARMMAAAPDLLNVLVELKESAAYWSEYGVPLGIVGRIDAAIAKATGGAS